MVTGFCYLREQRAKSRSCTDLGDYRTKDVEEMNGHFLTFNKNIISINANPFLHRKTNNKMGNQNINH